jgi:threonine/homoserine/homoserine lactone efflux protein
MMNETIELVMKGIGIGLFISVPMGPIGMLCIQRTLTRGRKYGIITGLGASTSDIIYLLIAVYFVGFVVDILTQYQQIIQIAVSAIVVIFGWFIFRTNPSTQPLPQQQANQNKLNDYFSAFILTLSNPLILFVLIALMARFEFLDEHTSALNHLVGIGSVFAGAFIWWNVLTFLVSRFKNRLSYAGLKLLNRTVGIVLALIGLAGLLFNQHMPG